MSRLLPCIEDLLAAIEASPRDIAEIVVGRGPGSFTGVRIGVATAKGMAQGLGVPLYGVGTLDAIAWRIARDPEASERIADRQALLGVVGDAMRGEVYPARFGISCGRAERLDDHAVAKPDDVVARWVADDRPMWLAGNGLAKYRDRFDAADGGRFFVAPEGLWSPTGAGLLAAYEGALEADLGPGDPGALLPIYTRLSDAEESERARSGAEVPPPPASSGVGGPLGSETCAGEGGER
jgi:N6-L-threonylcarbamoyladenine synthase